MARPLRLEYEGAWYHVMNRGAGHCTIFHDDAQRQRFLDLLGDILERFGVETHAWCLMGNHYHLLLHTPHANLFRAMRHLDGVYTQHFNRAMQTDGPLFRGRYRSIVVDADAYLLTVSRYIHRNPLEASLVDELREYPWSSYPAYVGAAAPDSWLKQETIRSAISARRENYPAFVEGTGTDTAVFSPDRSGSTDILGDEDVRASVLDRFDGNARETPDIRKPGDQPPPPQRIAATVAAQLGVDERQPFEGGRGRTNASRMLTVYLCQTVGRMTLDDIRAFFGLAHYGSVASALARYRRLRSERADVAAAERRAIDKLVEEKT